MDAITPTTELEAVNEMLSIIGESPVSTLENSGLVDAVAAQTILRSNSRSIQAKGWHFNTEEDYPLPADFDGLVYVPANTLRVDTSGKSKDKDLILRGQKLYDRTNHTDKIGETVYTELVLGLPFNEMPETARRYIAIRSGRMFQDRIMGSETLNAWTENDELFAYMDFLEAEAETRDSNMFTGSWSVASVLHRNPH